jgi:hypothetical protein
MTARTPAPASRAYGNRGGGDGNDWTNQLVERGICTIGNSEAPARRPDVRCFCSKGCLLQRHGEATTIVPTEPGARGLVNINAPDRPSLSSAVSRDDET